MLQKISIICMYIFVIYIHAGSLDESATTLVEKTQEILEDLAECFIKW